MVPGQPQPPSAGLDLGRDQCGLATWIHRLETASQDENQSQSKSIVWIFMFLGLSHWHSVFDFVCSPCPQDYTSHTPLKRIRVEQPNEMKRMVTFSLSLSLRLDPIKNPSQRWSFKPSGSLNITCDNRNKTIIYFLSKVLHLCTGIGIAVYVQGDE